MVRSGKSILLVPPYFFLLVLFILPLLLVLLLSLSPGRHFELGFSLEHYRMVMDPLNFKILSRSLIFAMMATLITLLLGFPMAYYTSFSAPRVKVLFLLLFLIPFWTNFLIRIYSWISILGREGLINSFLMSAGVIQEPLSLLYSSGAVILGLVYGELPFMILPIMAALDRLDPALLDAGTDLGASRFQVFRKIVLPLAMPGIITGIVFVFIPSLGNFVVPDILGGSNSFMIGNVIKNQFMTVRNWSFGSALSMILMVVVLLGISIYLRQSKSKELSIGSYL